MMNDLMVDKIADKYLKWFGTSCHIEIAKKDFDSMLEDGCWKDIDYKGKNAPYWQIVEHLRRINHLAVTGMDDVAIKGLRYWYKEKRIDTNWWWNDIGFPMAIAECGIMLRKKLPPELKEKVILTFNTDIADKWTGTNRAWFAQNIIIRGILEENIGLIEKGKRLLEENIYISKPGEEGIQEDYAFAQHGRQLYNNGYGLQILIDSVRWIDIFGGTDLAFAEEKVKILCDYLLDGCGRMCHYAVPDFNTVGREIVRGFKGRDTRMNSLLLPIEVLKKVSGRKDDLENYARFIKGDKNTWEHIKMFSSLNIFTSLKNGFYSSVRSGSRYVLGGDLADGKIVNGEDKLSGYRGCFVSQYMLTGREYDRIFPLWNWAYLPGVTCPDEEVKTEQGALMSTSFAGGLADGICGLFAMDLDENFSGDRFAGKKAAFFFGDEVVHLGCGIYSDTNVHTTLNQCHFNGEFVADGVKYTEDIVCGEFGNISHGGIDYISLMPQSIIITAEQKTDYWNKITDIPQKIQAEGEIFTAYINHKNGDSYAYAVTPTEDTEKDYIPPVFVNTEKVQAVKRGKRVCAVFYDAGEVEIGRIRIVSDGACFVISDGEICKTSTAEGYKEANVNVEKM